ncbi:hypothetical protein BJ085DRAFT_24734 [Dimargaris cristalligena]|uniref:B box-type domain-containing protein n=1 Tax=Dimargaris cristalligena TaxID=215637 RepID=A0A4P9ZQM7_9FUNG|nr:hypothetical protein BJ085DRAFT_24734 [Dimargaris cristalligena]|eukprot:RKP35794.1 hypothetical protein BJ085DRAFT_24734 [Dimargaris cristalligena]
MSSPPAAAASNLNLQAILDHDDPDALNLVSDSDVDIEAESSESNSTGPPNGAVTGNGNSDSSSAAGFCVECQDQAANVHCNQCSESFCEVCCAMLHRTGKRREHTLVPLGKPSGTEANPATGNPPPSSSTDSNNSESALSDDPALKVTFIQDGQDFGTWITERAKFIPLRLTLSERKFLRLLESALNVSEYTDRVDILSYGNKSRRMVTQIKDLCAILSGLLLASDYRMGQKLFEDRAFVENAEFFQDVFEIGRRHKIMNPEKMRDAYGKLMYLLQDSMIPEVQDLLQFSCVKPITTVYNFLEEGGAPELLQDPLVRFATKEIISEGKPRSKVQAETRQKEQAVEALCRKYASPELKPESIRQCLYSIGDNHSYLRTNRDPCDRMLRYLAQYFNPQRTEAPEFSLSIASGRSGARLSHDHETQYYYVNQTLTLWREIAHEMFMLWSLADQDLLAARNYYRLKDTGQGLNRVQGCPRISRAIHNILHRAQKAAGYWVGSSVVHLGDRNVPNALMFIDKYNQVASILNPIVSCLPYYKEHAKGLYQYILATFGNVETCKKLILADFFRYAFDGSGADNFFDAGSCIDGRLTSAWNWCSKVEKKPYYPVFLLSGFVGFNGEGF